MTTDPPQKQDPWFESREPPKPTRAIDSRDLMQGKKEIVIRHGDEVYRLSVTRAGKLILRK